MLELIRLLNSLIFFVILLMMTLTGCIIEAELQPCECIYLGATEYSFNDNPYVDSTPKVHFKYILVNEADSVKSCNCTLGWQKSDLFEFKPDWPIKRQMEPNQTRSSFSLHILAKDSLNQVELTELENLSIYCVDAKKKKCVIKKHDSFKFCSYRDCGLMYVDSLKSY